MCHCRASCRFTVAFFSVFYVTLFFFSASIGNPIFNEKAGGSTGILRDEHGVPLEFDWVEDKGNFEDGHVIIFVPFGTIVNEPGKFKTSISGKYGPKELIDFFQTIEVKEINLVFQDEFGEDECQIFDVHYTIESSVVELIPKFLASSFVLFAEPLFVLQSNEPEVKAEIARSEKDGEDPQYSTQWNLLEWEDDSQNLLYGIGCPTAWEHTFGDPSVRIGIVERGIDCCHPDLCYEDDCLTSCVVDGVQYLPNPPPGPGGSGFSYFTNNDFCENDSHGNSIAGVIGARSFNGVELHGIAGGNGEISSGCSLISIRLITGALGAAEQLPVSALASAYLHSSKPIANGGLGCQVINNSYSFSWYSETLRWALRYASHYYGTNFVFSKGETGGILSEPLSQARYPTDFDYSLITAVSGYSQDDGTLCFANCNNYSTHYGWGIDILAPADIFPALSYNGAPSDFCGTSGAVPHVCGAYGLLRSFLPGDFYAEDYEWLLKLTALDFSLGVTDGNSRTWEETNGHGNLSLTRLFSTITEENFSINTYSATGGIEGGSLFTSPETYTILKGPPPFLGDYYAIPCTLLVDVNFSTTYSDVPLIWGMCHEVSGVSAANPSYTLPYCRVVEGSETTTGCQLMTYLFKLYLLGPEGPHVWYPCTPSELLLKCRVAGVPNQTKSMQNYNERTMNIEINPNPFNAMVSISVPVEIESQIRVEVLDIRGRQVATLFDGLTSVPLQLQWSGSISGGQNASSGTYFIKCVVDGVVFSNKVALVK